MLKCHGAFVAAGEVFVDGVEACLEWQRGLALVVYVLDGEAGKLGQGLCHASAHEMHAGGVGLHHGGVGVDVDDEAGDVVALSVDEAEGIVVLTYEAEGAA